MARGPTRGQTAENTKGNGKTAGNMARVLTNKIKRKSLARGSGLRVKGRNGFEINLIYLNSL